MAPSASGPLTGVRVLEFAGIGPAPFAVMLLSDFGADVLRIDRPGVALSPNDPMRRGRASLELDLKNPEGRSACIEAVRLADVLIEGYRPGVMERLGLGPDEMLRENPGLIYARMTGWGQTGPLAHAAGHDINYIALTGALAAIGESEAAPPAPPLNLVGDFGGGSLFLALGIASALFERGRSGQGQVIDGAVTDGAALLMAMFHWLAHEDLTSMRRGHGWLGGAAPYYRCYRCADGEWVSIGAIEPQFRSVLLAKLGLPLDTLQDDPGTWKDGARALQDVFATKTRGVWNALLEGTDACYAPVMRLEDAPHHAHMQARAIFQERGAMVEPAPAPRFSRTPASIQGPPCMPGLGGAEAISRWRTAKQRERGGNG